MDRSRIGQSERRAERVRQSRDATVPVQTNQCRACSNESGAVFGMRDGVVEAQGPRAHVGEGRRHTNQVVVSRRCVESQRCIGDGEADAEALDLGI